MPVRFQVDPDFYDHPKTIDLSDAAVALWTRAGSYCAAKLTDGWVPDMMLARLSTAPTEAAAELVRQGLWRRAKGGHRFHQWDHRNLTKERVENDRKADRERKRTGRGNSGGKSGTSRSDGKLSGRNPGGIRAESDRIPKDSVSVSVSVSPEVSKKAGASPTETREQDHRDEPRSSAVIPHSYVVAREYLDRVPLADKSRVSGVVQQAIGSGYDERVIRKALRGLAKDSRPVTPDTLRIEIEGRPNLRAVQPSGGIVPPSGGQRGREW